MKLPIAFAGAFVIHAAAAVSVAALGVPHGNGQKPAVLGPTIDVEEEPVAPVVRPPKPEPIVKPASTTPALGTPRAQPVQQATQTPPKVESVATAPSSDAVPDPMPTQSPTTTAPARFSMTMPAQAGATFGAATATTTADEVVADRDVTVRARQVGGALPSYPREALAQGVELSAPLAFEIVVDTSGRVASSRELGHAGYGFDEAAAAALRTYRFTPATRGGHPVAVRMRWTVDFRLN